MPLSTNPRFGAILSAGFEPADRRTKKVDLSRTTAFLVPSIALAGGLGLAFWSIYSDYLRRRPPEPASRIPEDQEPTLVGGRQRSGRAMWRADSLTLGLTFLGIGGGIYFLFRGRAPGVAAMGYLPALVGMAFLAAHLSRHARTNSEGGGAERAGEDQNVGRPTSSPRAGRGPLP